MAIGRTFKEALQKGWRGLEAKRSGLGVDGNDYMFGQKLETREELVKFVADVKKDEKLRKKILEQTVVPKADRIFYLKYAFYAGFSTDEIFQASKVDPWFLEQMHQIVNLEQEHQRTCQLTRI